MLRIGSRAQVMHGNAKMTGGGLKKKDLKYNKQGKIVSKKMSCMAKKEKRLQKAGYKTKKGEFKLFKRQYGGNNIIDQLKISESNKDEILNHDYIQIWTGCYNNIYIKDEDITLYFDSYFRSYIDRLKETTNSCLILVEPRIFGKNTSTNEKKRIQNIENIIEVLSDINVYLIDDINNDLLNNIIQDFSNYILILNMTEYSENSNPIKQIPDKLKNALEARRNYIMFVSRNGIPYLIAENTEQIELIKSIIKYFGGMVSFDNKLLQYFNAEFQINPFIRQIKHDERKKIKKFIQESIEKYNEFTSYRHPIDEDCKIYKKSKERTLCNDIKEIREIEDIDDIIKSNTKNDIEYLYVKMKELPEHSNIIKIIIPKDYPFKLEKKRIYIKFEYKNRDFIINKEVKWIGVSVRLKKHLEIFLSEISYKNHIINRLKIIRINNRLILYNYLLGKEALQHFIDFYWDRKEEYKYPIDAIKDLYSIIFPNKTNEYNEFYTRYEFIEVTIKDIMILDNILKIKYKINIEDLNKYDFINIWIGCYNTAYVTDGLDEEIKKDDGYFKNYIDKLKKDNSCLIIVEPRIFGEYDRLPKSFEKRLEKITNVMKEIMNKIGKIIPIYLFNIIENNHLLNMIKLCTKDLFILNMNEYIGSDGMNTKFTQIPLKLIQSLYERNKQFEMSLSNEKLGPLIAKNIIDLIIIKVIISNKSEIISVLTMNTIKVNNYKNLLRSDPKKTIVHPPHSIQGFLENLKSPNTNYGIYKEIIKSSFKKQMLPNNNLLFNNNIIKNNKINDGLKKYTIKVMRDYLFNNNKFHFT